MTDPLDYASLSDTAKSLVRRLREGPVACGVPRMAAELGVDVSTVFRAMAVLKSERIIDVDENAGRPSEYILTHGAEREIKRLCEGFRPREPEPYTELRDVEKAREDRARWAYARGYGPAWALELGAKLAGRP